MKRKGILFLHTFILIGILTSCTKTDWRENFREHSKSPFGTYIIANETKNLFPENEFVKLDQHVYDYFDEIYYDNESDIANYVCIKSYPYYLSGQSIDKLLRFVAAGNDMFLSSNYFDEHLKDSLNFQTINLDSSAYKIEELLALEDDLYLHTVTDSIFQYPFDKNIRRNYFSEIDSTKTTVLGFQKIDSETKPNFIKIQHGEGNVYLHTQPIAFTNYYMINGKQSYAENIFSYLPNRTIIWDPQTKNSTNRNTQRQSNTSALRFFMQHDSLNWALYVAFISLLLFLLFNARRKQRAIQELKKLKNSTKDFTHTIANLYLKEENHKNLATKKITYFLEKVRTKYHIETRNLNDSFIERLAAKSGNTLHTTRYLTNTIIGINKKLVCTQDELIRLNTLIENFWNKT